MGLPPSMPGCRNTAWLLPWAPILSCLTATRQGKDSGAEPGTKSLPAHLEPLTPDLVAARGKGEK